MKKCIIFLIVLIGLNFVLAESKKQKDDYHLFERQKEILLANHEIDTRSHDEFHQHELYTGKTSDKKTKHIYLVHFNTPYSSNYKKDLEKQLNLEFFGYLPQHTWLLETTDEIAHKVQKAQNVFWVGIWIPSYKLPKYLTLTANIPHESFEKQKENFFYDHLIVTLSPDGKQRIEYFANKWQETLQSKNIDCSFNFRRDSISIQLGSSDDVHFVAEFLSKQNQVFYVEAEVQLKSQNKWSTKIVQSGNVDDAPFSNLGLTGDGQVIALFDAGWNLEGCFFEGAPFTTFDQWTDDHNSVVYYSSELGDEAEVGTHGTFCAGQIVGESSSLSEQNGLLPNAKIFFVDISPSDGRLSGLSGIDPYEDLYPIPMNDKFPKQGNIQLHPYGSAAQQYGTLEHSVDRYAYDNRKFLGIFPVGNEGPRDFNDPNTVTVHGPGAAKNTLSVGVSVNSVDSYLEGRPPNEFENAAQFIHEGACLEGSNDYWNNYAWCAGLGQNYVPCNNFKSIFCDRFTGQADQCCGGQLPVLNTLCCEQDVIGLIEQNPGVWSPNSLAWFSSQGPASDGRIKPDVVAPGARIFSASSNADCGFLVYEGSSYAATTAAAAASMVNEYLETGRYSPPANSPQNSQHTNPSGALLKAILVNSGQPLSLLNQNDQHYLLAPSTSLPNQMVGFGRIQLDRTLPLDSTNIELLLLDDQTFTSDNSSDVSEFQTQRVCIDIPENAEFIKITLTWYDKEAVISSGVAIIDNLDLVLVDSSGYEYRGNGGVTFDAANTVEQVYIAGPTAGSYSIMIHPTAIHSGDTPRYSLVVSGQFSVSTTCHTTCPLACGFHGSCVSSETGLADGICLCEEPYAGVDCTLTPCYLSCSGNGYCNGNSGTCECDRFWTGDDCSNFNPVGFDEEEIIFVEDDEEGLSPGATAGISVACFFVGVLIGGLLAIWITMRYLLKKQKKRIAEFQASLKAKQSGGRIDLDSSDDSSD